MVGITQGSGCCFLHLPLPPHLFFLDSLAFPWLLATSLRLPNLTKYKVSVSRRSSRYPLGFRNAILFCYILLSLVETSCRIFHHLLSFSYALSIHPTIHLSFFHLPRSPHSGLISLSILLSRPTHSNLCLLSPHPRASFRLPHLLASPSRPTHPTLGRTSMNPRLANETLTLRMLTYPCTAFDRVRDSCGPKFL